VSGSINLKEKKDFVSDVMQVTMKLILRMNLFIRILMPVHYVVRLITMVDIVTVADIFRAMIILSWPDNNASQPTNIFIQPILLVKVA
jgi:hypothetical protein